MAMSRRAKLWAASLIVVGFGGALSWAIFGHTGGSRGEATFELVGLGVLMILCLVTSHRMKQS